MFTQMLEAINKERSNASRPSGGYAVDDLLQGTIMPVVAILTSLAQAARKEPTGEHLLWYPEPSSCSNEATCLGNRGQAQHPWQPYAAQLLAEFESHVRVITTPAGLSLLHDLALTWPAHLCAVGECPQPNALAATAITAGPGSTEQQRLFGLLCSLLKRSSMLVPTQQTVAEECRLTAASVAARLAQLYAAHAAASSDRGPYAAAAAGGCSSELLPWLVRFGRCCLQWATQLQRQLHGSPDLPDAAVQQAVVARNTFMGALHINSTIDVPFAIPGNAPPAGAQPVMSLFLAALQTPLQDAGVAAHVSAAGVDAGSLLAKIHP